MLLDVPKEKQTDQHVKVCKKGQHWWIKILLLTGCWGARDGTVVRALASHQCGPGSNPGVDAICGLSLLLVLSLAPRGFFPGTPVFPSPQKPTFPNSNSCWNARKRFNEFLELLNAPWVNKLQNFTRHLKARGLQLNGTLLLV